MTEINLPSLPPASWVGRPAGWQHDDEQRTLSITAAAETDWFNDPVTGARDDSAAALLFDLSGDFALSARVEVAFGSTFDAGVLCLYEDADTWAKLCFEYSPAGQPMIVSVVTRGDSDDANSTDVFATAVYLRVLRTGRAYAFHASADGIAWNLVRVLALGTAGRTRVGFLAQSPQGPGCRVTFSEITLSTTVPTDLRSGA